jgi:hypothetical protein
VGETIHSYLASCRFDQEARALKQSTMSVLERRARIGRRHFLASTTRTTDPAKAADAMVGFHGTDPTSFYLAARARVKGLTVAAMENSLYERRDLLRILGMRRTLFVASIPIAGVIQASSANDTAKVQRSRLIKLIEEAGISTDPSAWLEGVAQKTMGALERSGPSLIGELIKEVPELLERIHLGAGTKWAVSQPVSSRIVFQLAAEGKVARGKPRGSWISSQHRWVALHQWLEGGLPVHPADTAREELVRLWLATFGPGTVSDLKWWTGWTMGQVRKTLASVAPIEVDLDGTSGLALAGDLEPVDPVEPWVALVPALDATPMGWTDRDWYLGPHKPRLFDRNGNVGPTIWCDGRVVGGWAQTNQGSIAYHLLEEVGAEVIAAIEQEAGSVEAFAGGAKITPRFRTPLERELAS